MTLKIIVKTFFATITVAFTLSACSDESSNNEGQANSEIIATKPGQVVAIVNGVEITIHELNTELARIRIQPNIDQKAVQENALKALVTRKIFEQEAVKEGFDRKPEVLMALKRSRSTLLARSYIASKNNEKPIATRAEAEDFVFENSDIFAERTYYIFDSIIIGQDLLSEEQKDEFEALADMDKIEQELGKMDIQALRKPFTAYSETLPKVMRDQLPTLVRDKTVFFIVQKGRETIVRFQKRRAAALTGINAIDVATRLLNTKKSREYLANLQSQLTLGAEIEFVGEFSGLHMQADDPIDNELKEEIGDSVTSEEQTF